MFVYCNYIQNNTVMSRLTRTIGFTKESWKEFAAFFGRNQQATGIMKWFLRVLSIGLTFIGVSVFAEQWLETMGQTGKYSTWEIGFFAAFLAVAVEYGWNNWLPIVIRQVIQRKLGPAWGAWNIMFVFNLLLVLVAGGLNGYTVYIGGDYAGRNTISDFKPTDTSVIDSTYQSQLDSISKVFDKQRSEAVALADEAKANAKALIAAFNASAEAKVSHLRRREASEETSFRTLRYQYKADAAESAVQAQATIVKVDQDLKDQFSEIQSRQDRADEIAMAGYQTRLSPILSDDEERRSNYQNLSGGFYYFMFALSLMAWLGLGVVMTIEELYKFQTMQGDSDYMHDYSDPLLMLFWEGVKEVADAYLVGFFVKAKWFFLVWAKIIGSWASYLISAMELMIPTPTDESLPEDFRVDPGNLAFKRSTQRGVRQIAPTGSTGGQQGGSTGGQQGGSTSIPETPQSLLTTGSEAFTPTGGAGGATGGQQDGNVYQIIVQNNEPLWPHIDGITGVLTRKTLDFCMSSRSTYRDKIKKLDKRLKKVQAGQAAGELAEIQKSIDHAVGVEQYWDNAIMHLRAVRDQLKNEKRHGTN